MSAAGRRKPKRPDLSDLLPFVLEENTITHMVNMANDFANKMWQKRMHDLGLIEKWRTEGHAKAA